MNYSKEATTYLNTEHIRFLGEGNRIPELDERIMAAFDAGMKCRSYSNLDFAINNNGEIILPVVTK
jgi:hypothetical protein